MRRGPANTGVPAPDTHSREPRVTRCCARCRRGVPGFGELPCGYHLKCKCHEPKPVAGDQEGTEQ